jgi:hypothetical protein
MEKWIKSELKETSDLSDINEMLKDCLGPIQVIEKFFEKLHMQVFDISVKELPNKAIFYFCIEDKNLYIFSNVMSGACPVNFDTKRDEVYKKTGLNFTYSYSLVTRCSPWKYPFLKKNGN